ncbi:hypothetical protein [Pseudoramibacter sp.]|jgi:hypothetical protein|uniref:hypothetical protein n=1 Tax=Pseudoramibacter sp. TaxID=2034862 RepID=UPI0025F1F7BC|nr:hypothetical protein [Pseudoramibacter sp.]MCH4071829.1 hypothetical protein [Pseudoramibacter sp.]MCH4105598.1 hypothetical protein [Pseudoramibacter sp.]
MAKYHRRALGIIAVCGLVLAVLGFIGLAVGGGFADFVRGMSPGVTAGLSALILILIM